MLDFFYIETHFFGVNIGGSLYVSGLMAALGGHKMLDFLYRNSFLKGKY